MQIFKRINSNDIREMLLKEIKNIANTTDSNDNVGFDEEPEKMMKNTKKKLMKNTKKLKLMKNRKN